MGPSCYWVLLELCTEKLWEYAAANPDKSLKELSTTFPFHVRFLTKNLHIQLRNLPKFLNSCSTLSLLRFKQIENEIEIEMPKLLEYLDSDFRRTRSVREPNAPQNQNSEEEIESPKPPEKTAEEDSEKKGSEPFIPGFLNELVRCAKEGNNTPLSPASKATGLTSAKDVLTKTGSKGGRP